MTDGFTTPLLKWVRYSHAMTDDPREGLVQLLLDEEGVSPAWVTRHSRITAQSLTNWTTGVAHPSIRSLLQLAEALGRRLVVDMPPRHAEYEAAVTPEEAALLRELRALRAFDPDVAVEVTENLRTQVQVWQRRLGSKATKQA